MADFVEETADFLEAPAVFLKENSGFLEADGTGFEEIGACIEAAAVRRDSNACGRCAIRAVALAPTWGFDGPGEWRRAEGPGQEDQGQEI